VKQGTGFYAVRAEGVQHQIGLLGDDWLVRMNESGRAFNRLPRPKDQEPAHQRLLMFLVELGRFLGNAALLPVE
jgi:hypothetical protein